MTRSPFIRANVAPLCFSVEQCLNSPLSRTELVAFQQQLSLLYLKSQADTAGFPVAVRHLA